MSPGVVYLLALLAPSLVERPWDMANCRKAIGDATPGHVCTPEHLEADRAQLAASPDSKRLRPEQLFMAVERGLVERLAALKQQSVAEKEREQLVAQTERKRLIDVKEQELLVASKENRVEWTAGSPHSKEFFITGSRVRMIVTDSLSALALVESNEDPLRVQMYFLNRGNQPLDVLPERFTLVVVEPKENAKALAYLSPKQVAKKIQNEAAWLMVAEAISSMSRALSGTSTTTTNATITTQNPYGGRTAFGTYNGVTTTYDHAANQQQTATNLARITDAAEATKMQQTNGVLLANTVFPGDKYGGVVHFKREKRAQRLLLRVPIGDQVLVFPLEVPRE